MERIPKTYEGMLIKQLTSRVDDWQFSKYKAWHEKSGLSFWTANGFAFFKSEQEIKINLINRIRLWKYLKTARIIQRIKKIEDANCNEQTKTENDDTLETEF